MRTFRDILRRTRVLSCLIALAILSPIVTRGADETGNVVESFDVARDGDALLVPVVIDRQEYLFCVDTGSSRHVVDPARVPGLQLLGKLERVNEREYRPLCSLGDAHVGQSRLPASADALQVDLSEFRKMSGHDICGFLGMPFLKTRIMEVDCDRGTLSFLKSVPDSAGHALPLLLDPRGRPMLEIDISEDDRIPMIVDTGIVSVGVAAVIRNAHFDRHYEHGLIDLLSTDKNGALTVDGYRQIRRGWLKTLVLGDFVQRRLGVVDGDEPALGLCLIARYVAIFDFPNQRLYLQPGRRIADPYRLDVSGLIIARSGSDVVEIVSVDPNSPGSRSGLTAGDRILKYDGKNAPSISLFKLRTLLATEGRRIKLEIENSSGKRDVSLELTRPKNEIPKKASAK